MRLNDLPCEIITRCFSYLSTGFLTDILLLENIPDNILVAAANNLNHLWHSNRLKDAVKIARRRDDYETSFDQYDDHIGFSRYHYETDFNRFRRIHKILEKNSISRPLCFHYKWEYDFQMRRDLDEINLAYHDQSSGIHFDLSDLSISCVRFFADDAINLKITCLSLRNSSSINLNKFPKLETFYGDHCKIRVDNDHPSLKNLYLNYLTFSSLPINLKKLVAKYCSIRMKENHPRLAALTVLALEYTQEPSDCSSLLRVLWNENLKTFSYIEKSNYGEVTNVEEVISMIGPNLIVFWILQFVAF